jgi:hypothetical protein
MMQARRAYLFAYLESIDKLGANVWLYLSLGVGIARQKLLKHFAECCSRV